MIRINDLLAAGALALGVGMIASAANVQEPYEFPEETTCEVIEGPFTDLEVCEYSLADSACFGHSDDYEANWGVFGEVHDLEPITPTSHGSFIFGHPQGGTNAAGGWSVMSEWGIIDGYVCMLSSGIEVGEAF
jgi:hypothetical protein